MSTYWTYVLIGYVFPIAWWLAAELYAVFKNDPRYPTFTNMVTSHTSEALLMAITVGLGTWLAIHWKQTFDWLEKKKAQRKEKRRGSPGN